MEDRRRMGYSVHREILDEVALDEMVEKSESKTSLSDKVKKSMRYWLYLYPNEKYQYLCIKMFSASVVFIFRAQSTAS